MYEKVFSDAKKGYEASTELMKTVFETESILNVSKIILDNGEIQFTQEYREQKRQEKLKRILDIIVRNAIDPRTHLNIDFVDHRVTDCIIASRFIKYAPVKMKQDGFVFVHVKNESYEHLGFVDIDSRRIEWMKRCQIK